MISEADRAWAAGVADAVGQFRYRETEAGSVLPGIFISTPKFDLVEPLASMTGVALTTVRRDYKRAGCGEHCSEPHLHVESTTARWSLTGARCTVFLAGTLPFLRRLRPEAEKALEAGRAAAFKPATVAKMYERGWPAI